MATYFNVIVPIPTFFSKLKEVMDQYGIRIYIERWNPEKMFYYQQIQLENDKVSSPFKEYRGFFFSSIEVPVHDGKLVPIKKQKKGEQQVSFYDDALASYAIEGHGGREDQYDLEAIKLRMISKAPEKQILKFYNALQALFKKDPEIGKGLNIMKHYDDKIYYYKTSKNMLIDFALKDKKYEE